jgi:phage-related protein
VPELGELLRSAQQPLDQDPLSPSAGPPAFDFSRLRIRDDAEEGDQRRTEVLDPATLGIRMATDVLRSLRGDPEDKSRRVQLQLARIDDPDLSSAIFAKLQVWLPSSEYSRVTNLVAEANASASPLPLQPNVYPAPVEEPDPLGDQVARDDAAVSDGTNRAQLHAEQMPWDAQTHAEKATAEAQKSVSAADAEKQKTATQRDGEGAASGRQDAAARTGEPDAARSDRAPAAGQQQPGQQQDVLTAALRARQTQAVTAPQGQQRAQAQQGRAGAAAMQQEAAAMPAVAPAAPVPQTGGAPAAPVSMSSGGTPPVALDQVDAIANAPDGPLARHQMRDTPGNTAERQPDQAPPGEEPIGAETADLPELDVPDPALPALPAQHPIPAAAYLPTQDIDVSGVPTADQLKLPESGALPPPPATPSFPEPPPPAMVAPRPGEQDPVEAQLAAQAAREGATIEPAPGQVGPDAAETEPDVAPESVAPGPEVMPTDAAAGPAGPTGPTAGPTAGPAGPESLADDAAAGPGVVSGSGMPAAAGPAAQGAVTAATSPGAVPQDASLEAGGGSCDGAPEPSADTGPAGGGGAAGGGPAGGGGSAAPPPQPPAPDVSQQQPQTALAVVGRLPVVPLARGLSGVTASVSHSVGQQREALAKSPPELQRPSGAPRTLHGPPPVAPPASYGADKVQKAAAKGPGQQAKPQGKQVTGGPTPADQVPAPKVTGNAKGDATATDVQNVQQAVNNVPTTDPALDHASVGVAPKVQLTGEADPALTDTQLAKLRDRAGKILTTGRDDATRPLGEHDIYPDVPPHEILKASVPKGGAAGPGAGAAGGAVDPGPAGEQAVSAVAQQQRGPQIQAAIAQGQAQMRAGEQDRQRQDAQDRQHHHAQIAAAIKKSTDDETKERGKVAVQARAQRKAWHDQENKLITDTDTEAGRKHDKARSDVAKTKSGTDTEINKRQQSDNAQITAKRKEAEAKAHSEQAKKQNQSGGWFGSVCSAISGAFSALVSAVKGIFDEARKFVQGVINKFKTLAIGLINKARSHIIGLISAFASVALALGGTLLVAFPALSDRFRKLIIGMAKAAIAEVNKVANGLEADITELLNLLGKALSALLDYLQKRLLAEIKSIESKIQGVINLVKNMIALLGQFAEIVRDVAADPGGWIRKLGSAIVNGIHYYLWDAIKTAVKNWFTGEIQQILGLGKMLQGGMQLFDVLKKGCFTIGKIVQMAWQAMIKALPQMLIQLVIEKLVAFLVPALGGIIQIVQGVIAAYNTISSIITAIGKFVAFLKDVKAGTAARPFAQAVAAGAVALINFVANWLLSKLKGAAQGVGTKLEGIAQKILAFIKRGAQSARKYIGRAFNAAKRGAKAAAGAIKRGIQAAGRLAKRGLAKVRTLAKRGLRAAMNGIRALGRRLAKTKFGKFLKNIYDKLKTKYQSFKSKLADWRAKFNKWREDRKKKTHDDRLEAAIEHIRPKVQALLDKGIPRPVLEAALAAMRLWYRLTGLSIVGEPASGVEASLSPGEETNEASEVVENRIVEKVTEVVSDYLESAKVQAQIASVKAMRIEPGEEDKIVHPSAFQTRRTPPPGLTVVTVSERTSPGVAAAGFNRILEESGQLPEGDENALQRRVLVQLGDSGLGLAMARPAQGDPVGEIRTVQQRDSGVFHVIHPLAGKYAKLSPLLAQIEQEDPAELAQGLELLQEGKYSELTQLPHWKPLVKAGLIHGLGEAVRSQTAQFTTRSGLVLGQAAATAAAEGREEEGVPFSKILTTAPMIKPGSVRAEMALRQRLTLPPEERKTFKPRKGNETVEGIVEKIINILRELGLLRGIVVAEGAEEEELLRVEEMVNKLLNSKEVRKLIFGDDFQTGDE